LKSTLQVLQLEYALLPGWGSFARSSPDEDPLILEIDVVDAELLGERL
jgi:hypothetical protein